MPFSKYDASDGDLRPLEEQLTMLLTGSSAKT